jgi:hypothetical protein
VKRAFVVVGVLAVLLPASASAGNLTIRAGGFFPRAEGAGCDSLPDVPQAPLFCGVSDLYTLFGSGDERPPGIAREDWRGFTGGAAYFTKVARNVEVGVSVDGYSRRLDTSYRDYTRPNGSEIRQALRLQIVPMAVALRLVPTSRRARLSPYVEVGADAISYKYEEFGDFIDFGFDDLPVESDAFVSEGFGFGFHAAGGLKIPISTDFSIVGEGRYLWAKDRMGDDFGFSDYEIDLGGWSATIGFNVRF